MRVFWKQHLWPVFGVTAFFFVLIATGWADQSTLLAPLTVSAEHPHGEAEILPGNTLRIDAAALAALPAQRGNYQDLFATVAGGYGGNTTVGTFSLRGLNQDSLFYAVGTSSNPLIPVLEDGAPLSVSTLRYLPPVLWDVDRVELLRGPQFLGPGPNGLGGALRIYTGPAAFAHDGKAQLEVAQDRTLRAGIAQDFVLRPAELALRVSAYHGESAGEVTNLFNGDDEFAATRRDRYQARLSWHPNKSGDAHYDLSLVHDESRGNPFGTARAVSGYDLFDRKTALNLDPSYPARRDAAILNATLALPYDLELKSTTAVQRLEVDPYIDLDETPILRWVANGAIDELRFTQDLSVARNAGPVQWRSGGYFEASGYDLGYSGVGIAPLPAGSPYNSLGQEDVRVLALYSCGEWEFVKNLHLSGGLRLQQERRELHASATLGPLPESQSVDDSLDTVLLPKLGLEWRPQETQSLGLQLSRGYRSGGVSFAPSLGSTEPYEPEQAWELELSGRVKPYESLALSAGVFHSWVDDQQVALDSPDGLVNIDSYIANAAKSRRYGSELEARWQPCKPLAITGTLGWIHTSFDDLTLVGVDRSGQPFPNAPEWTASLGVSYHHASGFFATALFSWADSTYTDPANPVITALEARRLLSARLGYSWQNARVYVFGNNLLDDDYALGRFDNTPQGLPVSGQIGPARSFGIGCELTW
jgi:outer membrane receptor protein involved in Fe transport